MSPPFSIHGHRENSTKFYKSEQIVVPTQQIILQVWDVGINVRLMDHQNYLLTHLYKNYFQAHHFITQILMVECDIVWYEEPSAFVQG